MNVLIVLLSIMLIVAVSVTINYVYLNHARSVNNRNLIDEHKKSIEQTKTLIALINALIASSDIKVDWKKYGQIARQYGVDINDEYRNLDVQDPEG